MTWISLEHFYQWHAVEATVKSLQISKWMLLNFIAKLFLKLESLLYTYFTYIMLIYKSEKKKKERRKPVYLHCCKKL